MEDEPRSGRPTTASDATTSQAVHDLILEDLRISGKMITQLTGISRERVSFFILNILDMMKLSAK